MNSIMDPSLALAKLSLFANCKKYTKDFDGTIDYLTTQVSHQAATPCLNIATAGQEIAGALRTKDNKGQDFEMLAVSIVGIVAMMLQQQQHTTCHNKQQHVTTTSNDKHKK